MVPDTAPAAGPPPPPEGNTAPESSINAPVGWHTVNDEVQGFDGNGWRKMPASVPLTLVQQRSTLGLFSYPGQNGAPSQVWIGMQDVQRAQ